MQSDDALHEIHCVVVGHELPPDVRRAEARGASYHRVVECCRGIDVRYDGHLDTLMMSGQDAIPEILAAVADKLFLLRHCWADL